jgi:hypothetical protein
MFIVAALLPFLPLIEDAMIRQLPGNPPMPSRRRNRPSRNGRRNHED